MTGLAGALPVLALIGAMLTAILGLNRLAQARAWEAELRRKIVHVATGMLAIALPWLLPHAWQVWLLLGLTAVAMALMRTRALAGLGQAVHGVARRSWGDYLLVLGVALTFALHDGRAILYVLPLAILAVADAAAALAGLRYGRTFYNAGLGRKSLEGSTIFFLLTLILSMICLLLLTDVPRANVIAISAAIAGFATLVEADSWHGFDNLFVPMGVLIFLQSTLDASAVGAVVRIGAVTLASGVALLLTRAAGLAPQVTRVHALAVFMLLSVAELHHAILPVAYLAAQVLLPPPPAVDRDDHVLHAVAALALVSFGFLAAGPLLGLATIDHYGLAVAAMTGATIAAAVAGRAAWVRAAAGLITAGAAIALWGAVSVQDPAAPRWHGSLLVPGSLVITLSVAVPLLAPRLVPRAAVGRIGALAGGLAALVLAWSLGKGMVP